MSGVTLGVEYPHPIVDHVRARNEALEALTTISAKTGPAEGPD
jgi:deoxyribodipyrimidine photolyase